MGIEKPGQRLTAFADLSGNEFVAEVRKRRSKGSPRLTLAVITDLRGIQEHYAEPERRLSGLVNQAYQLTDDDCSVLEDAAATHAAVMTREIGVNFTYNCSSTEKPWPLLACGSGGKL